MKCRIKKENSDAYFNKNISTRVNHWTYRDEAKIYDDGRKARGDIKKYKLKNVEVEYDK